VERAAITTLIAHGTLGHSVRATLSERLMAGVYAPGDKLSLRSVAADLGVSMMPVRDAVSRLVTDGALEVTPNKAVRVPLLDTARFRELTMLRIEIEGMAAARAAQARDDADLAAMSKAEAEFRLQRAKSRHQLPRIVQSNQTFHFAVYRAVKSPMLIEIITALWLKVGPILHLEMLSDIARIDGTAGERYHAAALAAVRNQDGRAARAAIVGDIQTASDSIIGRRLIAP